jgi:hypothetical protein
MGRQELHVAAIPDISLDGAMECQRRCPIDMNEKQVFAGIDRLEQPTELLELMMEHDEIRDDHAKLIG